MIGQKIGVGFGSGMKTVVISPRTSRYCDVYFPFGVSDEVDSLVTDFTWGECESIFNDLCNTIERELDNEE